MKPSAKAECLQCFSDFGGGIVKQSTCTVSQPCWRLSFGCPQIMKCSLVLEKLSNLNDCPA